MLTMLPRALSLPPHLRSRRVLQVVVGVLAVIALIVFNRSQPREVRTPAQISFDGWLVEFRERVKQARAAASAPPPIVVKLTSPAPGAAPELSFALTTDTFVDKMLRLLELTREANLFSRYPGNDAAKWVFSIEDGASTFAASLSYKAVESDVQAANLLKLLQVYSQLAAAETATAMNHPAFKNSAAEGAPHALEK